MLLYIQWQLNETTTIFKQEIWFENVIYKNCGHFALASIY